MAALYHLCTDTAAGNAWLTEWSDRFNNSQVGALQLRSDACMIAESLHLQRYKYLWDILFTQHPRANGTKANGRAWAKRQRTSPATT